MITFLMLGIIPGTTIQITFEDWLRLMGMLVFAMVAAMLFRHPSSRKAAAIRLARRLLRRGFTTQTA